MLRLVMNVSEELEASIFRALYIGYVVSNSRMIVNDDLEKNVEGSGHELF